MSAPGSTHHKGIMMQSLLPSSSAPAVAIKRKPLAQRLEDIRMARFFAYLTAITGVMFVINMVQIALLDRFNNRIWVLGFPLIMFGCMVSVLLVWMFRTRKTLLKSWHAADRPTRVARIGIVFSVFLPILSCEFLYLNLVAVPASREKVWTTSLETAAQASAPSLILFQPAWAADVEITPHCISTGTAADDERCFEPQQEKNTMTFQNTNVDTPQGDDGTIQYLLYDASKQSDSISVNSGPDLYFYLVYLPIKSFTDPIATPQNHVLYFAVFDPGLTNDLARAIDCGIVQIDTYPINQTTAAVLYLEQTTIADHVGAISLLDATASANDMRESCKAASFSTYNSYSYRMLELGGPPDIPSCTSSGSCPYTIGLTMSSSLITTRTSRKGTSWLQILLDEGSIVGGITFVTWFLGIYII